MADERALVAFDQVRPGYGPAAVLWATPGILVDLDEGGIDFAEAVPGKSRPNKPGLYVWEGVLRLAPPSFDGAVDAMDYIGSFRGPTPEEWADIMLWRCPWPDAIRQEEEAK